MKYLLWSKVLKPTSFSNVTLHIAYYLKKRGHDVTILSTELFDDTIENLIKRYMPHFEDSTEALVPCFPANNKVKAEDEFDSLIYFLVDPHHHKRVEIKAKKHIFYTVWSHQNYPCNWAIGLNQFDEVWTPSQANADAIAKTGLCTKEVKVVPHGYEPTVFYPKPNDNKVFRVGMCNSICNFKGADLAIAAFLETFNPSDPVELVMQSTNTTRNNKGDKHGLYYEEYIAILNEYPDKQLKTFYYQKDCNIVEMAEFYHSCNLILSPHRGDGFGMVPLEALACGVPVIVSEYHGPLDYIAGDYPFWVGGEMSWTNRQTGRHHFPDGGDDLELYKYFEPNFDNIKDSLCQAYNDWLSGTEIECKNYLKGLEWREVVDLIEGLK